jgi:hypothetical protein
MTKKLNALACIILLGVPLVTLLLGENAGSMLLGLLLALLQLTAVAFVARHRDWTLSRSRPREVKREDKAMDDTQEPLVLDLVEWIAKEPRGYEEAMTAWRTSCPRLTIWEDAQELGYLKRESAQAQGAQVKVTQAGMRFLRENGRDPKAA